MQYILDYELYKEFLITSKFMFVDQCYFTICWETDIKILQIFQNQFRYLENHVKNMMNNHVFFSVKYIRGGVGK